MRQGLLASTATLFGDVRAGRAAARSVVLGLKWGAAVAECSTVSFRCPGLTASFPAAQGTTRDGGATQRLVVPQEESLVVPQEARRPRGQSPHGL